MAFGTRVAFDAIRELAFGGITSSYAVLGTPFGDHARLISISNSTNEEVYISLDGVTDHIRLASNSYKLFDFSSNKIRDDGLFVAAGTQLYVKEVTSTPTSGSVWAEVMVAEGGK